MLLLTPRNTAHGQSLLQVPPKCFHLASLEGASYVPPKWIARLTSLVEVIHAASTSTSQMTEIAPHLGKKQKSQKKIDWQKCCMRSWEACADNLMLFAIESAPLEEVVNLLSAIRAQQKGLTSGYSGQSDQRLYVL